MVFGLRHHVSSKASCIAAFSHALLGNCSLQLKPVQLRAHCRTYSNNDRQVVFSGIQPTGVPHLGNYLGALRQWHRLQTELPGTARICFSIVDLHAITVPQDPVQLRIRKRQTLAALIDVGIDPSRCVLFYQSEVCFVSPFKDIEA